jgi:hypothetical protein
MQSDAFPTPPIYSQHLQLRLVPSTHSPFQGEEHQPKKPLEHLINEIELLVADCSEEESQYFWLATERLKIKHQVIDAMQKMEQIFLELAKQSSSNQDILDSLSEGLLYTQSSHRQPTQIPDIKSAYCNFSDI